jgi:hypothetical protein
VRRGAPYNTIVAVAQRCLKMRGEEHAALQECACGPHRI